MRSRVRLAVDDEAGARPRPADDEEEGRTLTTCPEARLRQGSRPDVCLHDHRGGANAEPDVEGPPVDRIRARRPPVERDELAEPDPDGERPAAELEGERGTVCEHRSPAALGQGRHLTALQDPAGADVDDAGSDLRTADVDAEGMGHAAIGLAFCTGLVCPTGRGGDPHKPEEGT